VLDFYGPIDHPANLKRLNKSPFFPRRGSVRNKRVLLWTRIALLRVGMLGVASIADGQKPATISAEESNHLTELRIDQ
jgi:hypothetical protein